MWVCRAKRGTPTVKSFQEIALIILVYASTQGFISDFKTNFEARALYAGWIKR